MNTKTYFAYWAERYKDELTNNILPFWLEYGLDHKHGGIYTCLDRDGKLMELRAFGFKVVLATSSLMSTIISMLALSI